MDLKELFQPLTSLLYWTMLAACTVGPGMVVTCARAGAEYKLHLIWPLIIASIFAYVSLEGTARLTIVSGKSLGECLQLKYSNGRKIWNVGVFCWVVVVAVFTGNLLYTANCFAGGLGAIYSLPNVQNTNTVRIVSCIVYGLIVIALLSIGKVDALGVGLGGVMVGMVVLFLVVVLKLGLDVKEFALGLLPISMPDGSGNIVMSLIGTTGTGFNLFLGGEMARGKTLSGAQRGIGFSTLMTFLVSVLILIVGSGTHNEAANGTFDMHQLAQLINHLTGPAGIWTFGLGFIAAALSSMLTIPLGASLTAESVFNIRKSDNSSVAKYKENEVTVEAKKDKDTTNKVKQNELTTDLSTTTLDVSTDGTEEEFVQKFPRKYFNGIWLVIVFISVVVMVANAPEIEVILVAQVYNGCLLPFFYVCLLLCINDERFMKASPQTGWCNCCLIIATFTTIVFTYKSLIENMFSWLVTHHFLSQHYFATIAMSLALIASVLTMLYLFFRTTLGADVKRSFGISYLRGTSPLPSEVMAYENKVYEKESQLP